ncbi:helix-turn-helix transcriptional regulator [Chitinophaga sp. LS1]|uniref:helix-turn-helix domain-containing protein n=1 Tax=Chitinophaga sp. LS1 TaxID=3051176 RepID=UPI002AAA8A17|nr:helix-turn-helix transcriptional regulator [Chitinophaga sp. LS1]WPV66268.1 helix-turn-helix transcriptional regulator [Chitinophaga sp. LS1]
MEKILKKLGANIKSARKKQGMTLLDLAVKTGFDDSNLAKIEKGQIDIGIVKLVQIAMALNVELNELYSIKES